MASSSSRTLFLSTSDPQSCHLEGEELLQSPQFNKGSAFTNKERETFNLHGLLPSKVNTLEDQVERAYAQFQTRRTPLGKNSFMTSLKDQNVVLYYRLLQDHLKEMFPIIYTPTEGEAIMNYSSLFRRAQGCFLNIETPDLIELSLSRFGGSGDIDIIACSDGEQILGIGDQGVGAILISVAKLVIYTLCAGVHPDRTLPIVLDVGTDNEGLLQDELYLGLRRPRAQGADYDAFIEKFVKACRARFPNAYIHFEDFGLHNARRILDRYMNDLACFNDDIQGTGCVTLAALYVAARVAGYEMTDLRIVIFGAGTAGIGIADIIRDGVSTDSHRSWKTVAEQIWCVDKQGLLLQSQAEQLSTAQRDYARSDDEWHEEGETSLLDVIKRVKPHVLIGTSTKPGSFTKEIVQEMARHVPRPIIFPLSNPTRLHEATPQDLITWTDGKVLTATGSPFPPVEIHGRTRDIAECNNSEIFPGIGLGAVLSRARLITRGMLSAAVKALASQAPALEDPEGGLLPDVINVREISVQVAAAVIQQAVSENVAQAEGIPQDPELSLWIREQMWEPKYRTLKKVDSMPGH